MDPEKLYELALAAWPTQAEEWPYGEADSDSLLIGRLVPCYEDGRFAGASQEEDKATGDVILEDVQLFKYGTFDQRPGFGKFTLTPQVADTVIGNFKAMKRPVFLTLGHVPVLDGAPAAAWVLKLKKKADGLFGRVRVLKATVAAIKRGEFKFFSPTINFRMRNDQGAQIGATLVSGAFTNIPFLEGMKPLAAAVWSPEAKELAMDPEKLKELLEASVKSALEPLTERIGKLEASAKAKPKPVEPKKKEDDPAVLTAAQRIDKLESSVEASQKALEASTKRVSTLTAAGLVRDIRSVVTAGIKSQKLLPKEVEGWEKDPIGWLAQSPYRGMLRCSGEGAERTVENGEDALNCLLSTIETREPAWTKGQISAGAGPVAPTGKLDDPKNPEVIELATRLGCKPEELAKDMSDAALAKMGVSFDETGVFAGAGAGDDDGKED